MSKTVQTLNSQVQIHEGGVYLIHLDRPFKGTQHYIGFAVNNMAGRMHHHSLGRGSTYMAAVMREGIGWKCVRTWPGESRTFERSLKNMKNAALLCPCCQKKKERERKLQQDALRKKRKALIRELSAEAQFFFCKKKKTWRSKSYACIVHHLNFIV